ncbi:MAG TPA: trimethylamine methyltransferase family protein [Anaerolineae bacterium]|nr:trimethylamine methyltransferase family protein [Anaerolineae bacterium]
MSTKINSIAHSRLSLNILSDEDVRRIHTATLDVIESTGVRFPSLKALVILEAHGATVNRETMVAKIPGQVIEDALKQAPPRYSLAARDPAQDLPLDGEHVFLGTDGCCIEVLDAFTGERRRTTKQDSADSARVADALAEVAFWWSMVSAQDCPPETRSLHELAAAWLNTTKHLQTESIVTEREMGAAIEMASAIAGGREALRQRPILSIMQCTTSPLGHDGGSLDAGLIAAEAGVPVGYMTMASCGSSAPITLAGNLVVGNAEVISALALMQLAHPGCPVYYAAAQTAMDLRTGGYTGGGPEDYLFGAATNRLADFYNVPLSMGAFATGAKEPDWQAAVDNSLSSFMAALAGSDMLLGCGLLHGSRILSYEMMVMDCEIFDLVRKMLEGIVVNDETLALDVIRAVGPAGQFLTQKHTRQHMRELWQPRLFDRRPYNAWEAKRDGAREWARQRAQDILKNHRPDPLDPQLAAELARIIATEERAAA